MNQFIEAILNIQAATWIATASLALSIAALIISKRRFSFDTRLIGAKKAAEIRILFLDYERKTEDFLRSVAAWEKVCRECEFNSEQSFTFYRQSAESFRKLADKCLQALKSPVTQETAIILEPITAYGDDLCKRLAAVWSVSITLRHWPEEFIVAILRSFPVWAD